MFVSPSNALLSIRLTGTPSVEKTSTREPAPGDIARLTRRLAAGEEAAFRELHERYFDRLYQFLIVIARGQEHEAQEALQQTFLRVLRHARAFETEEALWSWLKVVARSAACDAGRKQQRYAALLQNFAMRLPGAPEEISAAEDRLRAILDDCLCKLDAEDRRLIEGKYLEGATVKDLAAQTGLSEKAVESRLLRLRRGLREGIIKKLRME